MPDGYALPATLRTQRLLLRPFALTDADAIFAYGKDPMVTRYVTWPTHRTPADSLDFLNRTLRSYESGVVQAWAIHHTADDRVIGSFGLDSIDQKNYLGTVGYVLAQPYWRKGIMTETLRTMIDTLFRNTSLNRIEACCLPANVGSARVMEKSGMTFEGTRREGCYFKEDFRDTLQYAILRSDWQAMTRR